MSVDGSFWNRLCQLRSKSKVTVYLENKVRKCTLYCNAPAVTIYLLHMLKLVGC